MSTLRRFHRHAPHSPCSPSLSLSGVVDFLSGDRDAGYLWLSAGHLPAWQAQHHLRNLSLNGCTSRSAARAWGICGGRGEGKSGGRSGICLRRLSVYGGAANAAPPALALTPAAGAAQAACSIYPMPSAAYPYPALAISTLGDCLFSSRSCRHFRCLYRAFSRHMPSPLNDRVGTRATCCGRCEDRHLLPRHFCTSSTCFPTSLGDAQEDGCRDALGRAGWLSRVAAAHGCAWRSCSHLPLYLSAPLRPLFKATPALPWRSSTYPWQHDSALPFLFSAARARPRTA